MRAAGVLGLESHGGIEDAQRFLDGDTRFLREPSLMRGQRLPNARLEPFVVLRKGQHLDL